MTAPLRGEILAGQASARFARGFGKYVRWMLSRDFHAVRIARGGADALRSLDEHRGPAVVLLSHASWWDPLVGLHLALACCPSRTGCGPMDITQLRKFGFFRRLGMFGLDPDGPDAAELMRRHVGEIFSREPKGTLWITPQGRFADPRSEIVIRPGAAAIAAGHAGCRVVSLAIEYAFWLDRRPEVFVRAEACEPVRMGGGQGAAGATTAAWQRGMLAGMRRNAASLASLVMARDPAAFETLLGGETRINPFMDVWLRLRGQSRALDSARLNRDG